MKVFFDLRKGSRVSMVWSFSEIFSLMTTGQQTIDEPSAGNRALLALQRIQKQLQISNDQGLDLMIFGLRRDAKFSPNFFGQHRGVGDLSRLAFLRDQGEDFLELLDRKLEKLERSED